MSSNSYLTSWRLDVPILRDVGATKLQVVSNMPEEVATLRLICNIAFSRTVVSLDAATIPSTFGMGWLSAKKVTDRERKQQI